MSPKTYILAYLNMHVCLGCTVVQCSLCLSLTFATKWDDKWIQTPSSLACQLHTLVEISQAFTLREREKAEGFRAVGEASGSMQRDMASPERRDLQKRWRRRRRRREWISRGFQAGAVSETRFIIREIPPMLGVNKREGFLVSWHCLAIRGTSFIILSSSALYTSQDRFAHLNED